MQQRGVTLGIIGAGLLVMLAGSELLRTDRGTAVASLLLFGLTVLPGLLWLVRGMPHLPLWEGYAAAHLAYYWLPSSRENSEMLNQTPEVQVTCLLAVSLFLLVGWLVQIVLLLWAGQRRSTWFFGNLAVSDERKTNWAWWGLWGCALYSGATHYGLVLRIVPQAIAPHVASVVRITGALGVLFLAVRMGRTGFQPAHRLAFFGGIAAYSTFETMGGLMTSSLIMCGNALFGYILGARRLPMVTIVVSLTVLTFFNLGKKEWRVHYMGTYDSLSVAERLGDWVKFSWQAVEARFAGIRDEQAQTALERTDLAGVLTRVVAATPREVGFWEGRTYSEGIQLLVPQFINPNRPELHAVMREIGISYGFHTNVESSEGTNISIGPIAEAWMNRGWQALGLVGACYGFFFALGTVMAWGRRTEQAGFLLGVSFFSFTLPALEHLSMTLLMNVVQSLVIAVSVMFVLGVFHRRPVSAPGAHAPALPGSLTQLRAGQESRLD